MADRGGLKNPLNATSIRAKALSRITSPGIEPRPFRASAKRLPEG